jgi:hypothetical protein
MIELSEITDKINADVDVFGGRLPRRFAVAWAGYLQALQDFDLISQSDHRAMDSMLRSTSGADVTSPGEAIVNPRESAFEHLRNVIQNRQAALVQTYADDWPLFVGGYLAALLEQGVLSLQEYDQLLKLAPPIDPPDPIVTIFTGRIDEDELSHYIDIGLREVSVDDQVWFDVAWKSYLSALLEFGATSRSTYEDLVDTYFSVSDAALPPEIEARTHGAPHQRPPGLEADLTELISAAARRDGDSLAPVAWKAYLLGLRKWRVLSPEEFERVVQPVANARVPRSLWNHAFGRDAAAA